MASFNGLKKIAATDIQNSGRFYLGNQVDTGTAGQALLSGGPNQPAEWGSHTGNIQPLTMGTDLSLASGNATFDGSIPDTINAAGHGFGSGGNGIDITGSVITTDNDGVTISNSTGENKVLKVPNDLTISQNGTTIDTFNGSSAKTIDLEGKYSAGDGIEISGHTIPVIEADTDEATISKNVGGAEQLQVLKVPNTLTITDSAGSSVVYDGSSTQSITINDNDNQLNLVEGNGIRIISAGLNRTISVRPDEDTIDFDGSELAVLKVPNALTAGTNISFSSGTTYDGSAAITINSSDTDTTYQGGTGISINTATNPDTINCSNIPNTALQNSTISGVQLGSNLSTLTFYDSGGAFITSYNGAAPPTSVTLPAAGSTYVGGKNITVDTTPNPDEIDLDDDLTGIDSITMTSGTGTTTITGNNYAFGFQTPMTYFDLRSTTNIIPGGVLATVVQRTYKVASFNTSYKEYSSDFRKSFVAQSSNVMVEFRANVRADSKVFYGGLYNWNAGSWNTDQRNRFNFNDETDQDFTVLTWWMRNLTPGTTYYISPYFRGNGSPVYVYAGNSGTTDLFAPGIMRIYDGGNNVQIY